MITNLLKIFSENLRLLNSDFSLDKSAINYKDFGREFKYLLKSDGYIVSKQLGIKKEQAPTV